jgi:hypothetical protein
MRGLTAQETQEILGEYGFRIDQNESWYRLGLVLDTVSASAQMRVDACPSAKPSRILGFAEAANRWLCPNKRRILWIEHYETAFPSPYDVFIATRRGLGEVRSLVEAPGHSFEAHPYDQTDQIDMGKDQEHEANIIAGLSTLILVGGWDGWLIAEGDTDRIGFWEGFIYFYSSSAAQIDRAQLLINEFGFSKL